MIDLRFGANLACTFISLFGFTSFCPDQRFDIQSFVCDTFIGALVRNRNFCREDDDYTLLTECASDLDCVPNEEYCSAGRCRGYGTCGTLLDCLNPSNAYETIDSCPGYTMCSEEGLCALDCSTGEYCPPSRPAVLCYTRPCERDTTCGDPYVHCVDYFCGGCNAIYFDSAGNEVCNTPSSCSDRSDCARTQYCSNGECVDHGRCNTKEDCYNPYNFFMEMMCLGPKQCGPTGTCQKSCGGCEPCTRNLCSDADTLQCNNGPPDVTCTRNPCECESYLFDPAGRSQVC